MITRAFRWGVALAAVVCGCMVAQARPASACTPDAGSTSFSLSSGSVSWNIGAPPWGPTDGTPSLVFSGTANWGNTGANSGGPCVAAATGLQVGVSMPTRLAGTANPGLLIPRNEFTVTCADPGGSGSTQTFTAAFVACETYPALFNQQTVSWNTTLTFTYTPDTTTGADTYAGTITIFAEHT